MYYVQSAWRQICRIFGTPQLLFEIKSAQFCVKIICEILELKHAIQKLLFFNAYLKKTMVLNQVALDRK